MMRRFANRKNGGNVGVADPVRASRLRTVEAHLLALQRSVGNRALNASLLGGTASTTPSTGDPVVQTRVL
jgi:hypothetical protein